MEKESSRLLDCAMLPGGIPADFRLNQTQKDIPEQLLDSTSPLSASILVASFGDSQPFNKKAFDLNVKEDPNSPRKAPEKPLRYGKLPEIRHIFKADPKSPPKIITLFFTLIVLGALPVLFGTVSTSPLSNGKG